MKKLKELVTVAVNNEECVVLKVKPRKMFDLICLGCFNGDETMFRLTKGLQHTCTVWHGAENKHYSWNWGEEGHTLVSDAMTKRGNLIQSCIQDDFHVNMEE